MTPCSELTTWAVFGRRERLPNTSACGIVPMKWQRYGILCLPVWPREAQSRSQADSGGNSAYSRAEFGPTPAWPSSPVRGTDLGLGTTSISASCSSPRLPFLVWVKTAKFNLFRVPDCCCVGMRELTRPDPGDGGGIDALQRRHLCLSGVVAILWQRRCLAVGCVWMCLHVAWPRSLRLYHYLLYGTQIIFPASENTKEPNHSLWQHPVPGLQGAGVCAALGV